MSARAAYDTEARRDTPLALELTARIRREGPIAISEFMSLCLWHDQHGYYRRSEVLGAAGDFVTAPEISQVFGELIGLWSAVVWQQMGRPGRITMVELGPGRGTLMRDALRAIRLVPAFQRALRIQLVEASPALRARQQVVLAGVGTPVSFVGAVDLPPDGAVILLANEFLDAQPIDQFVRTEQGWRGRGVDLDAAGRLRYGLCDRVPPAGGLEPQFPAAPFGSIVEQMSRGIETIVARPTAGQPLAALLLDYGTFGCQLGETLQAVRQHACEHPLTSPGEADLSAHVDFSAVAGTAQRLGLAVDGPATQAEFLGRLGIVERASRLMSANPAKANAIELSVARLTNPGGMGGRFKAMGLRSPDLPALPGF